MGIAVAIRNLSNQFHRYMVATLLDSMEEARGNERLTDMEPHHRLSL